MNLSFTKPLEDSRGCWQISLSFSHTHSTETVDVAKLSPAALTAENTEEGELEGGEKKNKKGGEEEERKKVK